MKYKLACTLLLLASLSRASELPDAPSTKRKMSQPIETYPADERMIVHNTPDHFKSKSNRIFDWQFFTGMSIYGASNVFDNYMTQKYVGVCAFEGNPDLGSNPSAKKQALYGLAEFGGVFGGTVLFKWVGKKNDIPHWLVEMVSFIPASIGTAKHLHGGMQWVKDCQ